MKYFSYLSLFFFALTLSSCGPNVVYEQEHIIGGSWKYEQEADFSFDISDSNKEYDLLLTITHSPNFSYQNFYTNITTVFPTGEKFTDPLSIELANKMGSWLSSCDGEECTLHLLLRDDIKFKNVGKYEISFVQDTRDANLKGIQSMKLSLIETEE